MRVARSKGKSVNASTDGGKGDAAHAVLDGEFKRAPVAICQQLILEILPPRQTGPTVWITHCAGS